MHLPTQEAGGAKPTDASRQQCVGAIRRLWPSKNAMVSNKNAMVQKQQPFVVCGPQALVCSIDVL